MKKLKKKGFLSVVIAAAGSSQRMGFDKIFKDLVGRPVIEHTILAFQECQIVSEIIVVVKSEDLEAASHICRKYSKVSKVVSGGERRIDSVLSGVMETDRRAKLIGIHDGARPLVSDTIIRDTAELARKCGAAVPAIPLSDTVKYADTNRRVTDTPSRSELYSVQTPQVFDGDILKGALRKALNDNREITDDSMAVEALGVPVYLSEGSAENLKLTSPVDFITAEGIIERNENRARI